MSLKQCINNCQFLAFQGSSILFEGSSNISYYTTLLTFVTIIVNTGAYSDIVRGKILGEGENFGFLVNDVRVAKISQAILIQQNYNQFCLNVLHHFIALSVAIH